MATAAAAGMAGCTATAIPGTGDAETPTTIPDCPDLLTVDLTVCPGRAAGPLTVHRSADTVTGDPWSLGITVQNEARTTYQFDPYGWSVFRQADEAWHRIAPDTDDQPLRALAPGDQFIWQLTTTEPPLSNADQQVFLQLATGDYSFAVPFTGPDRVAAVVPFTVGAQG